MRNRVGALNRWARASARSLVNSCLVKGTLRGIRRDPHLACCGGCAFMSGSLLQLGRGGELVALLLKVPIKAKNLLGADVVSCSCHDTVSEADRGWGNPELLQG